MQSDVKPMLLAILATQERTLQELAAVQHSSNWGPLGAQGLRERFERLRAMLPWDKAAGNANYHQLLELATLELSNTAGAKHYLSEETYERQLREARQQQELLEARVKSLRNDLAREKGYAYQLGFNGKWRHSVTPGKGLFEPDGGIKIKLVVDGTRQTLRVGGLYPDGKLIVNPWSGAIDRPSIAWLHKHPDQKILLTWLLTAGPGAMMRLPAAKGKDKRVVLVYRGDCEIARRLAQLMESTPSGKVQASAR